MLRYLSLPNFPELINYRLYCSQIWIIIQIHMLCVYFMFLPIPPHVLEIIKQFLQYY